MNAAILVITTALLAAIPAIQAAPARASDEHMLLRPQDILWKPGPASIPPGAQVAVLYGNPSKDGMFAMRLKVPKGYRIAPHTHPKPEVVTVISGTARLGMGKSVDDDKAKVLPAGSFFAMSPGMPHFFVAEEDTVIQLNSTGPWSLVYVNPADDPRQKTR